MNILPKKRWHVRTKDNIARVRRDEANAREEELKKQEKLELAESEARINFLRKQSGLPERNSDAPSNCQPKEDTISLTNPQEHIDLFADFKSHIKKTNKDFEKEKKDEQEKYEKQIGYLTYLGQDTNESLKLRSWYEVAPKRAVVGETGVLEKDLKKKHSHDPLTLINALLPAEKTKEVVTRKSILNDGQSSLKTEPFVKSSIVAEPKDNIFKKPKKHKKDKKHKNNIKDEKHSKEKKLKKLHKEQKRKDKEMESLRKKENLEKLRKERLQREMKEKARQDALLTPKETISKEVASANPTPRIVQKYNSQFNPELAKQNIL